MILVDENATEEVFPGKWQREDGLCQKLITMAVAFTVPQRRKADETIFLPPKYNPESRVDRPNGKKGHKLKIILDFIDFFKENMGCRTQQTLTKEREVFIGSDKIAVTTNRLAGNKG